MDNCAFILLKKMNTYRLFFIQSIQRLCPFVGCLLLIFFFHINEVHGQACDATVPSYTADLTGSADSIWISPSDKRQGGCCGVNTGAPDNDRCVEFWLTLDADAEGIKFEIYSGAEPGGSMYYQLNCGPPVTVGENLCLSTIGPHRITFCKPGNNPNSYKITSIAKPKVTSPSVVSDACQSTITADGYIESTITWKSIAPGAVGDYNSYLSCLSGCAQTVATYVVGAPAFVDFEVCGTPLGGCTGAAVCNVTRVYFVNDKQVTIIPQNPTICFGGASTPITANASGGAPPYTYLWNTGETTQTINAGAPGVYEVIVTDTTSCPSVRDTVTVTAYLSPITANAGPDQSSCANNPSFVLSGSVEQATGGIWSGGAGTYSPSNTSLTPTYTPTAGEITGGSVTHVLTTTGNGTCPAERDTMILTIVPTPIVNANADQTVCGNNADVTLAGSVINAGGGRWSGGGGTYFPNDSTLNAVYRPSAAEISANAVITLTLTSIQNGSCIPVTDDMTITIEAAPTANAGPDQTICANNADAVLNGLITNATGFSWSGAGSFSPAGNLNTTYTATAGEISAQTATITLTATRATCNPVSDPITLTIIPAPTANAGPDRTVCGNNGNVTLNGIVTNTGGGNWTRSGTGTFNDANAMNATYTPSSADTAAGSVTLRLTTTGMFSNCVAVFDEMIITYTDAPTANAGTDRTVCANNASVVLNGSVAVATGGAWSGGTGIYSPNSSTLNATYTPSAAEITARVANLTLTTTTGNGLCNPATDQMIITITPAPVVNAGVDVSVCGNNATVPLNGSVTIDGVASTGAWTTSGTGTFNPNANTLNASYIPSAADTAAGTVTLRLTSTTNGNCIAVFDEMIVTITDAPSVNAGANQTVCANNAVVTLNGSVRIATGGTWVGGAGTFNPDRNTLNAAYTPSAGELGTGVTLTLTTTGIGNCTAVSDQMQIIVTPPPVADAGDDILACANNAGVTLDGSVTIATGGTWSNGCGTYTFDANTLNAFYVPCAAETSVGISSLILTTTGNGNCLPVADTVLIIIQPAPTANAGLDRTVCANNPDVVLNGAVTNQTSFSWSGGTGTYNANNTTLNATYTPSAAEISARTATLTLTANRNLCNPVSDQMTITITPAPIVNAGPDVTVCGNNATVALNGSVTIDGVASTGAWTTTGTGTFNPNASTLNASYIPSSADTAAGTVTLTLTSTTNGNCIAVADPMTITITDAPTVNAGPNQTVCGNRATVTLNGALRIATAATWLGGTGTFNPNANTLNANYTPSAAEILAGTVTLTLTTTSQGNCSPVSDPMTITITPAPVVNAGPDQSICANNATATLAGSVTVTGTGIWTGGNGIFNPNNTTLNATYTPTATEITNTTVTLTLTSTNNGSCNPVADDVIITITDAPEVDAGPDQQVCASSATVPLNGVVTGGATGGNWTTTGAGSFSPNSTTLNGSYIPLAPDQAGSVTLTLTSTGFGNCIAVDDEMTITFTVAPFIDAGPNQIVCTNDLPIQLAATGSPGAWSGGAGTYSPNSSALNATYTPSAGEITAQTVTLTYTTTPSGACVPLADDVTISIPPAPVVDAGSDVTICGDVTSVALTGSVANAGGGLWTTTGTGTFSPDATTLNATYNPSPDDVAGLGVTLVLTSTANGSCTPVADTMILTITTAPTITAGPDQTICADAVGVNLNASVTVATGGIWDIISGTGSFNDINILNPVYTPSDADTTAGTVTLRITSTGNGTCVPVSDQITITITPAPTVNAGPDQTICADLASTPLSGSFTVASGGTWTSSGSGIFSPNNTISNPSYFPSDADTAAHSVMLTFSTTGNGTCNSVSDFMILTIDPTPVVNAGPDQTVCGDIALVSLNGTVDNAGGGSWATSGSGSFVPDNTTLNGSYDPSVADTTGHVVTLTLTSTLNGTCNPVTDQMIVNFTPSPLINAGPDQTICGDARTASLNATVFVATGGTWTTSGSGTFSDDNILNPVYTASDADTTAGFVTLTVTSTGNGTCIPVSDDVLITIANVPIVNAGNDTTVCGDVAGVTLNGTVVNATGGLWSGGAGSFSPNANTLNATYIPTAAEKAGSTVILTLTSQGNGTCNPVADPITVTITPPPTVFAGADQTVCADIGSVNLNGSVTIATGGTWTSSGTGTFGDANSVITTYTPSATDISNEVVVLTLTSTGNGTCNPVIDQLILNITPAPVINAGPDVTICADMSNIVLNGSVTVAGGATWTSSGTGTFSPNENTLNANYFTSDADTTAGSVTLVLTSTDNGTCNAVRDTMILTITPAPVVIGGPDVTVCADVNSILLNGASVANALGGTWTTTGNGSFAPNASTINPSYVLSADDKAAGNIILTLTSSGNGTCMAVSDPVQVTITPAPTVNAGIDQTVCATTSGIQLNGAVTVASGGIWSTASGTGTFSPDNTTLNAVFMPTSDQINAGLAILRLTSTGNGTCNSVTDEMRITISPAPEVNAGPNQTLCASVSSVPLNGTITNATGGTWTTSGTGTFADASALSTTYTPSDADKIAGNITLTLTSTGNGVCSSVSDNVTIGFSAIPAVDAGPSAMCTNASGIGLSGTVTNAGGGTWTTSSGTGTFTSSPNILTPHYTPSVADQGVGSVIVYLTTTGNGPCPAARDSIMVGIQPDPTANAGVDQIVCADVGTVTLSGAIANAGGGRWTSSGGGAFSDSTDLNAIYTLSAVDIINTFATITLTTTGNGFCAPASDQMVITITPAPTVNAGPDQTVCGDIAGVVLNGSVTTATGGDWTTSGTGSFNPDASTLNATYIPSAADTAAGSVTLTLTTTGNGTCNPVSDQMVITITPTPTVNAGADYTVCGDVAVMIFSASTTVATGVTWTSSGTGTFDDPNASTTRYTISAADTAAGLVRIAATTTGNGTCNAQSDTLVLTITPAPIVIASAANACADSDTIQLSGIITVATGAIWTALAPASGVFAPNNTTLNAGYVPSAADKLSGVVTLVLTTTGSGDCNEVTDTVTLNIVPAPVANAGPDQTICSNVDVSLNGSVSNAGGGEWTTLGTGTFPSGATVLNGTYVPSSADTSAGSVTLVLTTTGTGFCSPVTDTMLVTFTPAPFADAGPAVICQSAGAVSIDGIAANAGGPAVWSTAGDGVFGDPNALSTTYTPGGADNPSVVITLTVPGIGTCNPATDDILINITTAPIADANVDQTVCADIASVSLSGIITNAGGGIWSTPDGTGTFADDTDLNTSYTPSDADTTAGAVSLVLTTTGNGVCLPVTDTMIVTITPAPTVNAGPASVCANAPPVVLNGTTTVATATLWSTSGDGNFGDATALSTTYNPGPSDLVSVTLTLTTTAQGTCNPVSDNITLFVEPPPVANANVDQTICADAAGALLDGSVSGATGGLWTTSGTGTFDPDATTLGATYIPSDVDTAAHSVNLVLTTTGVAPCNPVSDTMVLTINPVPVVNAGNDQTVCGDIANINLNGFVLHAGGGTWSTPDGTGIFADANNLNTTYDPTSADTAAGAVTFVLTSTAMGTCNPVTDTMIVTITDAPFVDAGPPLICSDAVSIPLSGIRRVATGVLWTTSGNGSFAPNNISLNTNYIPSADDRAFGSVTLTLTTTGNGTCNPVNDVISVFLTPGPTANAGADQGICADALTITLTGSVTNAPGGTWTTMDGGNVGFADPNALNTTYTMTAADTAAHIVRLILTTTGVAPCNPASDTVVINITPAPVAIVNAGSDTTVCESNPDVPLTGNIANAGGGMWTTTNGTGIFTPNAFTLDATYMPSGGDVGLGVPIELVLESTGNGICNPVTDTMLVTINPRPTANAGPDDTVCADIAGVPLNGIITTATQGLWITSGSGSFSPDANSLNATYVPSAADTADKTVILTLQTIDNGACTAAFDNMTLTITPAPTVNAGFDQTTCADADSISLSGEVTIASGGTWTITSGSGSFSDPNILNPVYRFSDADTTAGSVTLRLTTTGTGTCIPVFDEVVITITSAPIINAGPDQTICANDPSISLAGSVTVSSGAQWTSDGTGTYSPSDVALVGSYFPTAADTAAGTLTFVLTSTGNGSCNTVRDTMIVTIDPAPIANAGPDQTVCADIGNVGLNGSVANAPGGTWTSSGTGTFPDPNILNATYVPSDLDTANGIVILNLASTGTVVCSPDDDNMRITITPAPVVNAGADQTVCADITSIALNGTVSIASGGVWTTSGTGTFSEDSTLSTTYTPSAADKAAPGIVTLTLTSTGNGTCNPVSDDLTLTITPAPTANAGPNRNICADAASVTINGAVTVASGGVWTTSGTGSFAPNPNTLVVNYVPSAADRTAGLVGLTLTTTGNGTCNAVEDEMRLTIVPAPTVNAGPDQTICADSINIQLNATKTTTATTTWTTSGSGSFTPNANSLTAMYVRSAADSAAGIVNLRITTTGPGTCNPVFDDMRINITPAPTANAGPDQGICADASAVNLNGSTTVATSGVWSTLGTGSFSPDPNGLSRSYIPTADDTTAGSVTLVMTTTGNGMCKPVTDTLLVSIAPVPIVNAGGPNICSDVTGVTLNGTVLNASGGLWSTSGTGNFTPNNATLNARYNPSGTDVSNGFVVLTLTSDGHGTCNAVQNNLNVIITPLPVANAGIDQRICRGASTVLIAESFPDLTYVWYTTTPAYIDSSGIINVTANADTSFVLIVTDAKGCSVNDTVTVLVVDPPILNLADNYCFEFGTPLDAAPVPIPAEGNFQWFRNDTLLFGENSTSMIIEQLGTHMIGYNYGSCSVFDTTDVTPLPVLNGLDIFTCLGLPTTVITTDIPGATFQWTENGNPFAGNNDSIDVTASITPYDTSTYIVTVTNTLSCQNNDTIYVIPVPPPTVILDNTPSCIGESVTLDASVDNVVGWEYQWHRNNVLLPDTDSSITVNTTGSYMVTYRRGECMTTDTSEVTFYSLPVPNNLDEVKYCNETDDVLELDAGPSTRYNWLNTPDPALDTLRTVTVGDPQMYYVTITNEFNCSVTDSILVRDVCPPRLFISQAFIPGGGNPENSHFYIKTAYVRNFSITIFNRWGEVIFHKEELNTEDLEKPENNWDGTYRGEPMPVGVYPYIIKYQGDSDEHSAFIREDGKVVLIR